MGAVWALSLVCVSVPAASSTRFVFLGQSNERASQHRAQKSFSVSAWERNNLTSVILLRWRKGHRSESKITLRFYIQSPHGHESPGKVMKSEDFPGLEMQKFWIYIVLAVLNIFMKILNKYKLLSLKYFHENISLIFSWKYFKHVEHYAKHVSPVSNLVLHCVSVDWIFGGFLSHKRSAEVSQSCNRC